MTTSTRAREDGTPALAELRERARRGAAAGLASWRGTSDDRAAYAEAVASAWAQRREHAARAGTAPRSARLLAYSRYRYGQTTFLDPERAPRAQFRTHLEVALANLEPTLDRLASARAAGDELEAARCIADADWHADEADYAEAILDHFAALECRACPVPGAPLGELAGLAPTASAAVPPPPRPWPDDRDPFRLEVPCAAAAAVASLDLAPGAPSAAPSA